MEERPQPAANDGASIINRNLLLSPT